MRLTKQTGHAMRILIECAVAGDDLVKIGPLADGLGITRQNAFKIVHLLARAGFVASVRGPSGGIRLARPATQISVGDIVGAMEATSVEVAGDELVDGRATPLSSLFGDALAAFISVLDAHTLADLAGSQKPERRQAAKRTGREPARKTARKA